MFETDLQQAADWAGGRALGANSGLRGVCIDSRAVRGGELFVALPGSKVDGHDYVAAAAAAGAAAALVARALPIDLPQILVDDPERALGRLAARWRQRFSGEVLGVTGSNGKTTVKEMLAAVLGSVGPTLATQGNLNNQLGVPLTLLRLGSEQRYAVIEMGANHAGEIAYLRGLARPRVVILTNAGAAHLEGFGSLAGVVAAKGEIVDDLGPEGVAVLNADDPHCEIWARRACPARVLRFGFAESAQVRGETDADGRLVIVTADGRWYFTPVLPGRHNLANALATFAACSAVGLSPEQIVNGLGRMQPVAGRMTRYAGHNDCRLVDDSYNANPDSVKAALDWLSGLSGESWLVLGDMAELGADEADLHADIGRRARVAGVSRLFAVGELSRHSVAAFGAGAGHYANTEALIAELRPLLHPGVTLLIKGSRRMGMERIARALRADITKENG